MKKNFLIFSMLLAVPFMGCNSNSNAKSDNENKDKTVSESSVSNTEETNKKGTKMLTREDFLVKVMNYEKNPETWNYLGDKPAIIDFYADWCGPCKMAAPVLEELALEYADKIHIYKIDTEKERQLSQDFGIQSIPAFLFIPMNGQPVMSSGIARTQEETKEMFVKMINDILLNPEK